MKLKKNIIKIKNKLRKIYLSIFYGKKNYNINDLKHNWNTYLYLKKKYIKYINNYNPTSSEKELSNKVWWCWLQGEDKAPDLCKSCLNSLRKNLKDREIIVVTADNYLDYIDLPKYIIDKFNKGLITRTHFSDILRLQLLATHGGTWIDSTVLCTDYDDNFFDKPLFVYNNFLKEDKAIVCSSWFITAEKNNPIIMLTRDLLFEYWKNNNKLINYFLVHIFFTIATEKFEGLWKDVHKFSNVPPHILQFEILNKFDEQRWNEIIKMSSIHKLNNKEKFELAEKNSYYDYIIDKYK